MDDDGYCYALNASFLTDRVAICPSRVEAGVITVVIYDEFDDDDYVDSDFDVFPYDPGFSSDVEDDRPVDQINCTGCGRPMTIWADEPLKSTECGPCQRGLTPDWEF